MVWLLPLFSLASVVLVRATVVTVKRQAITTLSPPEIDAFAPFTHFASTAYCNPSATIEWTCGSNCDANEDFEPVASGGDGNGIQFWYVGYFPPLDTVIVAHQGTDTSKILADLTDANLFLESLNPSLFPGIPSGVEVHSGFANEQAKTASQILSKVQGILSVKRTSSVTVVGHSLGAALALLDGVFLSLHIPKELVTVVSYGMPRVGNQAFANFVDSQLAERVMHVNNKEDPIPTVPPVLLGYHHPSGEIHIQDSGAWDACPGQDNPDKLCTAGDVTILNKNENDHAGPYAGITMGC